MPTQTGLPARCIASNRRSTKCTSRCSTWGWVDTSGFDSTIYRPCRYRLSPELCAILEGHRGVAQLGLARLLGVQEVTGSNPVAPIFDRCADSDRVENAVRRPKTKQSRSPVVDFPLLSIHYVTLLPAPSRNLRHEK